MKARLDRPNSCVRLAASRHLVRISRSLVCTASRSRAINPNSPLRLARGSPSNGPSDRSLRIATAVSIIGRASRRTRKMAIAMVKRAAPASPAMAFGDKIHGIGTDEKSSAMTPAGPWSSSRLIGIATAVRSAPRVTVCRAKAWRARSRRGPASRSGAPSEATGRPVASRARAETAPSEDVSAIEEKKSSSRRLSRKARAARPWRATTFDIASACCSASTAAVSRAASRVATPPASVISSRQGMTMSNNLLA